MLVRIPELTIKKAALDPKVAQLIFSYLHTGIKSKAQKATGIPVTASRKYLADVSIEEKDGPTDQSEGSGKKAKSHSKRKVYDIPYFLKRAVYLEAVLADPALFKALKTWLEYKKARRQLWKTDHGLISVINSFKGIWHTFPDSVERAIQFNWSGVFPPENEKPHEISQEEKNQFDKYYGE